MRDDAASLLTAPPISSHGRKLLSPLLLRAHVAERLMRTKLAGSTVRTCPSRPMGDLQSR